MYIKKNYDNGGLPSAFLLTYTIPRLINTSSYSVWYTYYSQLIFYRVYGEETSAVCYGYYYTLREDSSSTVKLEAAAIFHSPCTFGSMNSLLLGPGIYSVMLS